MTVDSREAIDQSLGVTYTGHTQHVATLRTLLCVVVIFTGEGGRRGGEGGRGGGEGGGHQHLTSTRTKAQNNY